MKNLITNKLDVIMFITGIASFISLTAYVVWQMNLGNYYMSF